MPIYLKHNIVHIHIPKTGGSSIRETFEDLGDHPLFNSGTELIIHDHSPQHSTYEELKSLALIPEGFTIISVVRNPYDRFLSKYNEQCTYNGYRGTPEQFARGFFWSSILDWDNHSLPQWKFLEGAEHALIMRFEHLQEDFKKYTGLDLAKHALKSNKAATELPEQVKKMVVDYWGKDFELYGYER